MKLSPSFLKDEAEKDLNEKLTKIKSDPMLRSMQRATTTLEVEVSEAILTALDFQLPRDAIAEIVLKVAVAVKLGAAPESLREANEFGRALLKQLPVQGLN